MFLYASFMAFACIAFLDATVCFELGRLKYEMMLSRRATPAHSTVAIPDGGDCIEIISWNLLDVLVCLLVSITILISFAFSSWVCF